jgi:exonuclease SbcD
MKKAISILSTDFHLKPSNIVEIYNLVKQQCELAKEKNIEVLCFLGDIFDNRISQRMEVLNIFEKILQLVESYDLKLYIIPGNHDKTLYDQKESFVDPFKFHPNVRVFDLAGGVNFEKIYLHFIPFFSTNEWLRILENLLETQVDKSNVKKQVLLSHIAVTGSQNNDGAFVETPIKVSTFKVFDLVLLGHYHNMQQIGRKIHHIPSIRQNNFGEDNKKGFTILYDDATIEFIKSDFKEYVQVNIDLDLITKEKLQNLKEEYQKSRNHIRFNFSGGEAKIKALDVSEFTSIGIDVKRSSKEIDESVLEVENKEFVQFNKDTILKAFEEFCIQEKLDFNTGKKYIDVN